MFFRLYIQVAIVDARAETKKNYFNRLGLKAKVKAVWIADCCTIDKKLNPKEKDKAKALLCNALTETASEEISAPNNFHLAIEVGFLPGVTDNAGGTAKETLEDGLKIKFAPAEKVYTSQVFFILFEKNPSSADREKITESLFNPLIQQASLKTREKFLSDKGMDLAAPRVKIIAGKAVSQIDLEVSDEELAKLGKLGIKNSDGSRRGPLSMSVSYLKAIRRYFNDQGRKPTDVELETLAQTWSEHCKHTIFADPMDDIAGGLYKTYIKGATEKIRREKGKDDFCVSVFTDNSGAINFNENYLVTHKVETHNTPSALDPFGGSITGIVGVNRDCLGFGLGAKPIINVYGFCLADPGDQTELFRDSEGKQKMLSASRIMEGVVAGINAGGNQSGIPTNLGFLYFDPRYRGKPLVFAGTVGLIPKKIKGKPAYEKRARPGDLIVVAGGRVGADGIHGATFSSEGLSATSPATAVQIGDPITQKKMSDALVKEARDQELYTSITDCGAGGLSSAVGEMAQATGGCLVNLDTVPLKYPGLAPWQIWISESQERMVMAVPEKKWPELSRLFKSRGVEATAIGHFNDSGQCQVKFGSKMVLDIEMDFLHNGRPIKKIKTKKPKDAEEYKRAKSMAEVNDLFSTDNKAKFGKKNFAKEILSLIQRLNIAGFEFIPRQYDHEVQAGSVLKPLAGAGRINAEATVTRPVLSSKKGVVLSSALYPGLTEKYPYRMAAMAIDGAIRAAVAAGADIDNLALLDNFCWSSSDEPERLRLLKEAARACHDLSISFGTPFISGKDSMFNDFKGYDKNGSPIKISIPPTLLISAIGVMPDIYKTVSLEAKLPGDYIYLLGENYGGLYGSEYHGMRDCSCESCARPPEVIVKKKYLLYKTFFNAAQKNLFASAISASRGGLAIALIKALAGGRLGGAINLAGLSNGRLTDEELLFSESGGRILATVNPKKAAEFEKQFSKMIFAKIGEVGKTPNIKIFGADKKIIANLNIKDALRQYRKPLEKY